MEIDVKALALLGARARLAELVAEMDAVLKAFPGLAEREKPAPPPVGRKPRRKRPKMSKRQRKAVSVRMKKYWAERRRTTE